MANSSDNPVSDMAEGATKGFLNWTKEQIILLAPLRKERAKKAYYENIDDIRLQNRIKYWRKQQMYLALQMFENRLYTAYSGSLSDKWLTISLS